MSEPNALDGTGFDADWFRHQGGGPWGEAVKVFSVAIENFRGIRSAKLLLPDHAVLIGDNNTGKSTVFEAIDLALGPDRLSRRPPVDEHDFYQGRYLPTPNAEAPESGSTESMAARLERNTMVATTMLPAMQLDETIGLRHPPKSWPSS